MHSVENLVSGEGVAVGAASPRMRNLASAYSASFCEKKKKSTVRFQLPKLGKQPERNQSLPVEGF